MTDHDVESLLRRFAKVSLHLDSREMATVQQVAEVVKSYMRARLGSFVADSLGSPVLLSYSSDGTPCSTKRHIVIRDDKTGQKSQRSGRHTDEYLVQNAFVRRVDEFGDAHTIMVMRDPVPLTNGKSGWAMFAVGLDHNPSLREAGHWSGHSPLCV